MKYAPRDQVAWRAARAAEIAVGLPIRPKGECHMCGWAIGADALWCSTACAQDYAVERERKNSTGSASGSALAG